MKSWRLGASDTHLYPGARLRCLDAEGDERMRVGDFVIIEFSDAAMTGGQVMATAPGAVTLKVDVHRTTRGARVGEKQWILVPGEGPGAMRVHRRA